MQLTTVTSNRDVTEPTYELGFDVVARIAGAHAPPSDFSIELAPRAPAVGIVRPLDADVVAAVIDAAAIAELR